MDIKIQKESSGDIYLFFLIPLTIGFLILAGISITYLIMGGQPGNKGIERKKAC